MRANADSFYCIGSQHEHRGLPCQDYAYSGVTKNGFHYAIVSDGCSGSDDTDLGSRLLVHWFRTLLEKAPETFEDVVNFDDKKREEVLGSLRLLLGHDHLWPHTRCYDATLVAAFWKPGMKEGVVFASGDGGFAFKNKDGSLEPYFLTISKNAPPYLSYHLDEKRKAGFLKEIGDQAQVALFRHDYSTDKLNQEALWLVSSFINWGFKLFLFNVDEVDMVSVYTDGVASFNKELVGHQMYGEPVKRLLNVKTFEGQFMKRTSLSNLKRMAKEGWSHFDDLAIATLKFHDDKSDSQGGGT